MKNKGFKVLFGIYIFMVLADIVSTLIMGELAQHLEANPLIRLMGGFLPIILINIGLIFFYRWVYLRGSVNARFNVMFVMTAIILIRIIAVKTNIGIYMNPPSYEQAIAITQAVKNETMRNLALVNVFPFFNAMITWFFFQKDHNVEVKK